MMHLPWVLYPSNYDSECQGRSKYQSGEEKGDRGGKVYLYSGGEGGGPMRCKCLKALTALHHKHGRQLPRAQGRGQAAYCLPLCLEGGL